MNSKFAASPRLHRPLVTALVVGLCLNAFSSDTFLFGKWKKGATTTAQSDEFIPASLLGTAQE